jgi:ubiquinone/menaquinone biosynthesis C-methylase UbiE
VSFDACSYRQASLENWEDAAAGWRRRQQEISAFGAPVSAWLIEAVSPQPGERVLELAAGMGETGMLAAELVAPHGGVVVSDQAEAMLEGARVRAHELGLSNVEFQVLNAEWIDLPLASVDAVLCRWGYMLMADPLAALSETRRVLRPGGRVALAVWDSLEHNPWAREPAMELIARGLAPAPDACAEPSPGPFTLADSGRVAELLEQAGFLEVELDTVELTRRHDRFVEFWDTTLDISRGFHDAVLDRPEAEIAQIQASLAERLRPFTDEQGALVIPARTLVARASA